MNRKPALRHLKPALRPAETAPKSPQTSLFRRIQRCEAMQRHRAGRAPCSQNGRRQKKRQQGCDFRNGPPR